MSNILYPDSCNSLNVSFNSSLNSIGVDIVIGSSSHSDKLSGAKVSGLYTSNCVFLSAALLTSFSEIKIIKDLILMENSN